MILTQHHRVSKKSLLSIYSDVTKKEREKERKEIHVKDLNTTLFYFSGNFHLFFLTFFFFKMVFFNYICKKMFHQPEPVCSVQRLRCHFVLFLNVVVCGTFSNFFFFFIIFFSSFQITFFVFVLFIYVGYFIVMLGGDTEGVWRIFYASKLTIKTSGWISWGTGVEAILLQWGDRLAPFRVYIVLFFFIFSYLLSFFFCVCVFFFFKFSLERERENQTGGNGKLFSL